MKLLKLAIVFLILLTASFNLHSASDKLNSAYGGLSAGYNLMEKHSEFNLMIGYDRHFEGTPEFTFGLLVEGIFAERFELLLGIPIGFYPVEEIKLWIAPCFAFPLKKETEEHTPPELSEVEVEHIKFDSNFMLKFGVGYNYHFHQTNFSMLPFLEGTLVGKDLLLGIGVKFNFYF
ncbi:MAG: hypothetical protein FWG85_02005 [Bacteroidetes bacterium]|nr:hypothetical protein [Bacteroidota bacterium]